MKDETPVNAFAIASRALVKRVSVKCTVALIFAVWITHVIAPSLSAQLGDRGLPSQSYYLGFRDYYSADYADALKHFGRGANSALKIGPNERYLDSVCYWTMIGECHYQMGNFAEAISYYEQAIDLVLYYSQGDWQQRIQPRQIQRDDTAIQQARVSWYQSARGDAVARIPSSFSVLFGRLDAERVLVEGGVLQNAEIRSVDHAEIMRCAALAVYRRYTIKGITSHIDPFTAKMISGFARLPSDAPIIGKWNQTLKGLSNMSGGRANKATPQLQSALKFTNGLDHHLTPIALLALAKIAYLSGETKIAAPLALEASHSAAVYNQFDLVEEALTLGNSIHLSESRTVYEPLAAALDWSARKKTRMLQLSMILRLTDCLIESNNPTEAGAVIAQAKRAMSGTNLGRSRFAGQIHYQNAAIAFMNLQNGYPDLERALTQFQSTSLWLYRLQLINSSLDAGTITQRQAELIYERILLDPTAKQWLNDPMETVAYTMSAHTGAMERWFEILLARKNHEKAIQVGEMIRRHRFYESLPLAGRLLALRWMLTAPENSLTFEAKNQRADVYSRFPKLKEIVDESESVQIRLRELPLKPDDDSPEKKKQQDLFVQLRNLSQYLDNAIASFALKRQPADWVFPPVADYSGISKSLQQHQIVISSLRTPSGYHQYAITQQTRRYLGVIRERDLRRSVAKLFKSMGISDANNGIDASVLNSDQWKSAAADLKELLFKNFHDDQWASYKELIVIPDGILWYVPFEVLQTGAAAADWKNLNDTVKIRYLPITSMLAGVRRQPNDDARVAVITGKFHLKGDPELTKRGFEDLTDSITNATAFDRQVKIPSNYTNSVTDTLVVWHDMKSDAKKGAFALTPFFLDKGNPGSTIMDWLKSPWRGVEKIAMPAYSSAGAGGLKSRSDGSDLFFTSCGMMASGVRSVLISRWRVGGENSLDLSRDYIVKSREMTSVAALDESTRKARENELVFENEIRIKPSKKQLGPFKAEHPFFWAGNMLIDLQPYNPSAENTDIDPNDADDDATDSDADENKDIASDVGDSTNSGEELSKQGTEGSDTKEMEPESGESESSKKEESESEGSGGKS